MNEKVDWRTPILEEGRRAAQQVASNMSDELRIKLAALEILDRHMAAFKELAE